MDNFLLVAFFTFVLFIISRLYKQKLLAKRSELIDDFSFPGGLSAKLHEKYPHLSERDLNHVISGLREYFHICNIAGKKMVAMPSQAVDEVWHEFILYTKEYERFCYKALGRFLHHTPAEAMQSPTKVQKGIKTAWKISCFREKIEPKKAIKLPLLFALDAQLSIPDGYKYSLDCTKADSNPYCAGDIGCGSGCGGCSGGCGGD